MKEYGKYNLGSLFLREYLNGERNGYEEKYRLIILLIKVVPGQP